MPIPPKSQLPFNGDPPQDEESLLRSIAANTPGVEYHPASGQLGSYGFGPGGEPTFAPFHPDYVDWLKQKAFESNAAAGPHPPEGPPAIDPDGPPTDLAHHFSESAGPDDDGPKAQLYKARWIPPANRSPWPQGPKPTAQPEPAYPTGGLRQSIERGGPGDGLQAVEDFAGLYAEVGYAGLGAYAKRLGRGGYRLNPYPRPAAFADTDGNGLMVDGYSFNDPDQTTFYVLPTWTDRGPNYFTLVSVRRGRQTWYSTNLRQWTRRPPPIPPRGVPARNTFP